MTRVNRRRFLVSLSSVSVLSGIGGCVTDADPDDRGDYPNADYVAEEPDVGTWFQDVDHYRGTLDLSTEDRVRVAVGSGGGLSFTPPAIQIMPGTEVVWEWTGRGGHHNVVDEEGTFESELVNESGYTFSHTFESPNLHRYVCTPHRNHGMRGAVSVVGED